MNLARLKNNPPDGYAYARHTRRRTTRPKTMEVIAMAVSDCTGIPIYDMKRNTRKGDVVQARQIAMYFMDEKYNVAKQQTIGEFFNRDRCTVIHSCKVINNYLDTDKRFVLKIENIERIIEKTI